jgi:L-asparaginase/Glu-tRNA(Gln) amidotransferase subunit D
MLEQNLKSFCPASSIPLTMTGAMRSSNEIGSDGLSNLCSAIFVAMDEETTQHGVEVVMNEEIHAATYVTKTQVTTIEKRVGLIKAYLGMEAERSGEI